MPHGHTHDVLRRRGDRGRQGPQGAGLPDRLLDRPRRAVHRAEQGPAVLPVPGLQRPVRPGREHAAAGPEPPRGVLRRQGAAVVSAREDAPVAVQQQEVPQQRRGDAPLRRRGQRRRRRRRPHAGRRCKARAGRGHAGGLHRRPGTGRRAAAASGAWATTPGR